MEYQGYIDRRTIPSFSARFTASLIDRMIVLILAAFYVDRLGLSSAENLITILLPVITVTWIFYRGIMESTLCHGQTIGRAVQHLRVIDINGECLPLGRSFYRAAVEALFTLIPPMFFFDLACWLVDKHEHRTLHDQISGTVVVEVDASQSLARVRAVAVGVVLVVGFGFYDTWSEKAERKSSSVVPSEVAVENSRTFIQELELAATEGDPASQVILGMAYFNGKELPQDFKAAAKWFKLAADRGNAQAKYQLAVLYAAGKGVNKDFGKALSYLKEAADGGDSNARDTLSKLSTVK